MSVWCERAAKFHEVCSCVSDMFSRLTAIPNRALLYDVYQYTWDAKEATMLLDSYIAWLGKGGVQCEIFTSCSLKNFSPQLKQRQEVVK